MATKAAWSLTLCLLGSFASAQTALRDPFERVRAEALTEEPTRAATVIRSDHSTTAVAAPTFTLRAVLFGDAPLANLDGMIVARGDRLMDYTVERIDVDSVTLSKDGHHWTISLEEG